MDNEVSVYVEKNLELDLTVKMIIDNENIYNLTPYQKYKLKKKFIDESYNHHSKLLRPNYHSGYLKFKI